MKILVTFAVEAEFAPWRRLREFRPTVVSPRGLYEAEISGGTVRVLLTGMGPEHARETMRAALVDHPSICISSGLAGALKFEHVVAEILAPRLVRMAGGRDAISVNASLRDVAVSCSAKPVEMILSSDKLVQTARDKHNLCLQADAVDMESYAVLVEAARRDVPGVVLRAVSDVAHEDLPYDFDQQCDDRGHIRLSGLFMQVARRPHRLPALVRLGRQCRRAAVSLAQFLDVYVECLTSQLEYYELESPVAAT